MANRPNILWICTDSQRYDTLGVYGNPHVHTPNLDRLAGQGVLFNHCTVQNPVCAPSRGAMLTGRYPRTTRLRQNGQSIPEDEVLITRLMSDAGYVCGLSGKLHISACHPVACRGTERRINDGYDEFHWSHHPTPSWPTAEYNHWLRERGAEWTRTPHPDSQRVFLGMSAELHQTTWCARKAIDFMEANAAFDSPWLFSVNPFDPHDSFDPPEEYLRPYVDRLDEIPLPNYHEGELDSKPLFQQIDHRGAYNNPQNYPYPEMNERDHRLVRAAYWAMCDLIDAQVGRMLAVLEKTGQLANTIVVFTSDHGELLGDHGIYLKGSYFYEPSIRVPLIVSWPGHIASDVRSDALVELVDLAPTLLDLVGLPHPPGMQARSLRSLLVGQADVHTHREDVYSESYYSLRDHKDPRPYATMVRTRRHKLVAMHGMEPGELYDLQVDPDETRNLWNEPEYRAVKLEMFQRLCDRMAWTVDPLPAREAPW